MLLSIANEILVEFFPHCFDLQELSSRPKINKTQIILIVAQFYAPQNYIPNFFFDF